VKVAQKQAHGVCPCEYVVMVSVLLKFIRTALVLLETGVGSCVHTQHAPEYTKILSSDKISPKHQG